VNIAKLPDLLKKKSEVWRAAAVACPELNQSGRVNRAQLDQEDLRPWKRGRFYFSRSPHSHLGTAFGSGGLISQARREWLRQAPAICPCASP